MILSSGASDSALLTILRVYTRIYLLNFLTYIITGVKGKGGPVVHNDLNGQCCSPVSRQAAHE